VPPEVRVTAFGGANAFGRPEVTSARLPPDRSFPTNQTSIVTLRLLARIMSLQEQQAKVDQCRPGDGEVLP